TASQSRNPERVKIGIGQRNRECRAIRQPPRTVSASRRSGGKVFIHVPLPQFGKPPRSSFPLLPDHRPQPASGPLLKTLQHRRCLALAKIANPAAKISAQFLSHPLHFHPSRPLRQFPNLRFESKNRLGRYPPFRILIRRETEAQKLPFPWPCHRTLLLVHLELELRRDEPRDARHHSLPCPPATDIDVTVIRVPREPETSPLQLPVELVEHDVTQQGR